MGYPEFYIPDSDTNFTVFEIYAFDRDHAVPLAAYFETEYDYINIYSDGTVCTHVGNGGDPNEEVYELLEYSSYLEHKGSRNVFESNAHGAEIHYECILTPVG